jgi:hypothetical protein
MPNGILDLTPRQADIVQHGVIKGRESAHVVPDLDLAGDPTPGSVEAGRQWRAVKRAVIGHGCKHSVLQVAVARGTYLIVPGADVPGVDSSSALDGSSRDDPLGNEAAGELQRLDPRVELCIMKANVDYVINNASLS